MPTAKANYTGSMADPGTICGYGWKTSLDSFRTTVDRKRQESRTKESKTKNQNNKNQVILDY